jgi:hypothetical protein
MKPLKGIRLNAGTHKILLIGDSGSGKTTFIGTTPLPLVADFDGKGETSLAGCEGFLESYSQEDGWEKFRRDVAAWLKQGKLPNECQTLALDSLTFAADLALRWAMRMNGNAGTLATRADWGRAIDEIKSMLAKLISAPWNVIVTVHLSVEKDELLGGVVWLPSIYGSKLPVQLPAYFDNCWHTKVTAKEGTAQFTLQMIPDQRLKFLKNSGRGIWSATEEPNYDKLMKKLNAKDS